MDELLMERYNLAKNRIREICTEQNVQKNLADFFQITAEISLQNSRDHGDRCTSADV